MAKEEEDLPTEMGVDEPLDVQVAALREEVSALRAEVASLKPKKK